MNLFGLTANIIDALMLVLGKGGKFLNARGNRICFLIDIACLSYWFFMDISRGLYSQGISCIVSITICGYGFYNWGKKAKAKKEITEPIIINSSGGGMGLPSTNCPSAKFYTKDTTQEK